MYIFDRNSALQRRKNNPEEYSFNIALIGNTECAVTS